MLPVTPKHPLFICSVAQNCLAEAYVLQLLRGQPLIRTTTLKEFVHFPPARRRDAVFVVDLSGLELPLNECLRLLRARCLNARFLVLGHEVSRVEVVRFLVTGAHGYLPHEEVSRKLVPAIFAVAANQYWVSPEAFHDFLCEVASVLRKDADSRHVTTPREEQILELVRRRLSNREIAHLLQIRVSTVKFHVSNVLSKMQARNRHDLFTAPSEQLWKMLAP